MESTARWSRSTSRRASKRAGRSTWEAEGLYAAGAGRAPRRDVRHLRAAAERHRRAAHGPRAERLDPGRARPLAPDAAASTRSGSRATTTPASRRRTSSRSSSRRRARRARSSAARRSSSGRGRGSSRPAARSWASSGASAASLDYARERFTMDDALHRGRDDVLRPPLGPRLDLPREPDRQLVPVPPDRDLRPRGRARRRWTTRSPTRATRSPTATASSASRSRPSGRRRSSPTSRSRCTRTTRATGTRSASEVVVPVRRAARAGDRRRARRAVEFGSGALKITPGHDPVDFEIGRDHELPEPDGDRPRRADERRGRRSRRADAGRGRRAPSSRGSKEHGAAREARELPALGRHLRALPLADRAARLAAVVVPRWTSLAQPAIDGAARAPRALPSRVAAPLRDRVARGAPDWCVSRQLWWGHQLPIWTCPDGHTTCAVAAAEALCRVRLGRARARPGRARHLVLVGAVAVRDARLAGADAGARSATTRATSTRRRARSSASGRTG